MTQMNSETNGKVIIVKDQGTGRLGAVVCPEGARGVVFEDGEWVVDSSKKDLIKVGEAVFAPPRIEPFGKIPADAQEKYIEAALVALKTFREGGRV